MFPSRFIRHAAASLRNRPATAGARNDTRRFEEPAMLASTAAYELRFASLFHGGRGLAFPCDAAGQVNLDALSERARINYFAARTLIGRDFATPAVRPALLH